MASQLIRLQTVSSLGIDKQKSVIYEIIDKLNFDLLKPLLTSL
jgi:hypothetical protein